MNTMLKNNAGFDLKQLFIGSEGTLGVITRAVLRLNEAPLHKYSALCALPDYPSVLHTLRQMRQALGADLSAFEIMWPEFYAFASQVRQLKPLPAKNNFTFWTNKNAMLKTITPLKQLLVNVLRMGF